MIPHLNGRAQALSAFGWSGRDAEWLALVCLHSGTFLRAQYLAFVGQPHPELAGRFIRRCGPAAVEEAWNGTELRLCRIAARPLYRALGAEHVRHRRTAEPAVLLRRLLSLDYVLSHPDRPWLATEQDKVAALTAAGIRDLVRHALRHRPDHIVVGEVRGAEAADVLQALNTGHGGSLATVHANNAEAALSRLSTCAMQASDDLPWTVVCRGVVDGIEAVIHQTRTPVGVRRVDQMVRVRD